MDEALWDIKGKRTGMPVDEMPGGRAHDAVACYDHVSGPVQRRGGGSGEEVTRKSVPPHPRAVREGLRGGGFIPPNQGNRVEGGGQGRAFDEDLFVETIPPVFEYVRSKVGFCPKLLHDVHSHLTGANAVLFAKNRRVLPPGQEDRQPL